MAATLTVRQREVYKWVREFIQARGSAPTLREMQDRFGWRNPSTAHAFLKRLEQCGVIQVSSRVTRSIEIVAARRHPDERRLDLLQQRGVSEIRFRDGWVQSVRPDENLRVVLDDVVGSGGVAL